jgi:XAP5, circadian clock regulator
MGDLFYVENLFRGEQKKVKKRKKSGKATLSFALDDEGDGGGDGRADSTSGSTTPNPSANTENQRKKFRKNPAVDTSFLPDREREEAERRQREELRQQWLKRQEEMKKEEIEITYSYWDGSGHRKSVVVSLPFLRGRSPVVHLAYSARKVMILLPFWKNVDFNSLNFEGLTSTISCTLRLVNPYSAYTLCLSSPPHTGGSHHTTCQYVVFALLRADSFLFASITHFMIL